MNVRWALLVPRESAAGLARLRRIPALAVSEAGEGIWLRGNALDESLERELKRIPGGERFAALDDGQLVPEGCLVPLGRLPGEGWVLLADWLQVSLPMVKLVERKNVVVRSANERPFAERKATNLSLVPTGDAREPTLLETSLSSLTQYVATAPQWRIERWTFAATADGRAIVRGTPLAPIPGTQWVEVEGVATPAGFTWSPPVDAEVVRQVLQLAKDEVALLRPDGTWDRIAPDQWVRASRSALRGTQEALLR
ncbi:MAG TPA: hypothetical protein VFV87_11535 [Pirellulaceae bacterium]|nr:hypothetical protein [Pirellulaceae bacterium]